MKFSLSSRSVPHSALVVLTFLITGPTQLALAQTPSSPTQLGEDAQSLDPITVFGEVDTSAQRAVQLKASAPNSIEVITAEQLQQYNEQALGDALRRVPGVTYDGANRSREVRLRGLPGEYTQVLVNGRPMIDGESRRSFEVDRIPTGLVERVEVVRSPRASLPGQGAAGTVNIILKNGVEQMPQSELAVGAGYLEGNGEQGELSFATATKAGPLDVMLAGSVQRFRRSESKDEFEFDAGGSPDGGVLELNERRFDQINLIPRLALQTDQLGRFEFDPFYLRTTEFRDDIETDLEADQVTLKRVSNENRERVRESYGFRGGWERELSPSANLRLNLDWQRGETDTERDETRLNADGTVDRERQRTELIELEMTRPEAILTMQAQDHSLSFGVGASLRGHDETNGEIRDGAARPPREDRIFEIDEDIVFAFAEDVWNVRDNLRVTGGLRLEDSETETTDFFGVSTENDADFLLPSVNAVFSATPQTDLRFGVARTLRRPDLRALSPSIDEEDGTAADPDIQGNPRQDPESIWGLDLGVDHYFADNRGHVSLNLFERMFEDKIEKFTEQDGNRFVATPQNVGDARARGIELSARAPLTGIGLDGFTLWGNAGYTDSSVDEISGGSRPFLNQPDAFGNLGLDYFVAPWNTTLGLAVNHVTSVDQTQQLDGGGFLDQSIESRTRLDLSSSTKLADGLDLTLSITNLLGQTEDRVDQILDNSGAVISTTRTSEPTYQAAFARLNWTY
ncbi:TonB-dependent receptor plug domain-containing protein [Halomonas llamarensis]|uniref:TonB-dependent receptor n=1 Tax=Halomonas llamarensis TaxID=2945104 RepID=A0ABT0SUF5_9GAMM|nr:TonB-dependent receptor [Halomonas llamarensis]MCL7931213.1 TonB-dependent receptor [Halomonas llamarensis]